MAQNNVYVIRIENKTQEKSSPIAGNTSKPSSSGGSNFTSGQKGAQVALKALVAYDKFAAPFVDQIIQQHVGTIELRTGASELQQRTEFGLGIAKTAIGIGTSFLTGYAVGNLPGAILGVLVSGATTAINYANKTQTLQLGQNLETIALRGMNVRAGGYAPSYGASRLGRQ